MTDKKWINCFISWVAISFLFLAGCGDGTPQPVISETGTEARTATATISLPPASPTPIMARTELVIPVQLIGENLYSVPLQIRDESGMLHDGDSVVLGLELRGIYLDKKKDETNETNN